MTQPKYKVGDVVLVERVYLPHFVGTVVDINLGYSSALYYIENYDSSFAWNSWESEVVCLTPTLESPPSAPGACKHEWREYVGLMQRFTYCANCDIKQDSCDWSPT